MSKRVSAKEIAMSTNVFRSAIFCKWSRTPSTDRRLSRTTRPTYYLGAMEFIREENFRISLVTETMSRHTFLYIHQQIDNYRENFEHEKKNKPKYLMWERRMHLAIKVYQELLLYHLTLVHMEGSKDDAVREAARF